MNEWMNELMNEWINELMNGYLLFCFQTFFAYKQINWLKLERQQKKINQRIK